MKSLNDQYLKLMTAVYRDAVVMCSADVTLEKRDLKTIRSRVKTQGLSFLTITLPRFAKDFERSLANGRIDSTLFEGFRRVKRGSIPAFLQGMTSLIFDLVTGELIHDESIPYTGASSFSSVVDAVRQICRFYAKTEFVCAPKRVHAALESFVTIERSFSDFKLTDEETSYFLDVSDVLWHNAFAGFKLSEARPQHGPGATADGISGNQKYHWLSWYDRIEPYFSLIGSGYPMAAGNIQRKLGIEYRSREVQIVSIVPEEQELPVKVITVPKTLKAPRIIAIEPCCMQYAQQGIRNFLYERIESYWLTKGHINFRDQKVNQSQALVASATGLSATIDLSDASDRVPLTFALDMFRSNPDLREAILACRSSSARMPWGEIISPLSKFASMGSALCFPIEAMYFYTLCVMALLADRKLSCTPRNVSNVVRDVYVYGDDLVVPSANADAVFRHLLKYNCKVNVSKSFWTGKFRESCGVDAYDGDPVTPVYFRHELPENRQQSSLLISAVSTANQLYLRGFWRSADLLFKRIEDIVGDLPYVREDSEALGRISYLGFRSAERWNEKLQRLEVQALVPSPVYRTDVLGGFAALSKCLLRLERSSDPVLPTMCEVCGTTRFPQGDRATVTRCKCNSTQLDDLLVPHDLDYFEELIQAITVTARDHLKRSALHGAVTLKRRWVMA